MQQPGKFQQRDLRAELMLERRRLAAKLRASRAILNLSQTELAGMLELTQRSIYRLEQAQVEPKRMTLRTLELFWYSLGIRFEDLPDGGFTISVAAAILPDEVNAHSIQPQIERFPAFPARVPT